MKNNIEIKENSFKYSIIFTILSLGTMWIFSGYLMMNPQYLDKFDIAMFFPATIAIIMNIVIYKSGKKVIEPLIRRISIKSLLFGFLYPVGVIGGISLITYFLGITTLDQEKVPFLLHILSPKILFMIYILNFGRILGEEYGWRGFLLEHFSIALGKLKATLLVGLIWGLWHAPLVYILAITYKVEHPILLTLLQLSAVFIFSFPFSYAYFMGRNILPPMILHLTWNLFNPIILGNLYANQTGIMKGNITLINGEALGGILVGSLFAIWLFKTKKFK